MTLLSPKKLKYKKYHKLKNFNCEYKTIDLHLGEYGIKALESGYITSNQIETIRRICKRHLRIYSKVGKIWICIFPFASITKKPIEVRMGKGKGNHLYWACPVKKGRILFEFSGVTLYKAIDIYNEITHKMPIKVKLIKNVNN